MKQLVRCTVLTIPKKLQVHVRLSVDDRIAAEYTSMREDTKSVSLNLFPSINIQITRPSEIDENGKFKRPVWNPNDSVGMTKFNFPIFVNALTAIQQGMKIPALYTYQGKRLEINEAEAEKIRQVITIGNVIIELSAVVVVQEDVDGEKRLEGIKLKFNREENSVLLTLNELDSMVYNLSHLDIDSMSLLMYLNFITKPNHPMNFDTSGVTAPKPQTDIRPLQKTFAAPEDSIDEFAT